MTPAEVATYVQETAVLALASLGPSIVVPPPAEEERPLWRWFESPYVFDPADGARQEAIRALIFHARSLRLVRFADATGLRPPDESGPGGGFFRTAGPILVRLTAVQGKRGIAIALMGRPHQDDECDACGAASSIVVSDLVNITLPGDNWETVEPIGIIRSGCAEHTVEQITLAPDDVPVWAPWFAMKVGEETSAATRFFTKRRERAVANNKRRFA
jgi:hypothetical protein